MQDALENSMKNTTTTMRLAQMKEFYGDMWDLCMIKNEVATTLCMFDEMCKEEQKENTKDVMSTQMFDFLLESSA